MEVLDLQVSRRRLREMAGTSCEEKVRLGECEYCYTNLVEFPSGASMYNLVSSAFSTLNLDFSSFTDLPILTTIDGTNINIRRLNEPTYRFEHDGLPCVFIHGAGVYSSTYEVADEFDEYWGKSTRLDMPPYCSKVVFLKMNTLTRYSESKFADLLLSVQPSDGIEIYEMILITHGNAADLIVRAMGKGLLRFHRTVRWLGMNIPQQKLHIRDIMKVDNCNSDLQSLLGQMATDSDSNLEMTCEAIDDKGWSIRGLVKEFYGELSAGLCGAVASHRSKKQKKFLGIMETPETKGLAMKTLSDGLNRVDHCLTMLGDGIVSPKFDVQPINFWDGQMRVADRISGKGVRFWLHSTATKALETLVNGEHPDLQYTESELEEQYQRAQNRNSA